MKEWFMHWIGVIRRQTDGQLIWGCRSAREAFQTRCGSDRQRVWNDF